MFTKKELNLPSSAALPIPPSPAVPPPTPILAQPKQSQATGSQLGSSCLTNISRGLTFLLPT